MVKGGVHLNCVHYISYQTVHLHIKNACRLSSISPDLKLIGSSYRVVFKNVKFKLIVSNPLLPHVRPVHGRFSMCQRAWFLNQGFKLYLIWKKLTSSRSSMLEMALRSSSESGISSTSLLELQSTIDSKTFPISMLLKFCWSWAVDDAEKLMIEKPWGDS